jgi:hypothetical protein
VAVTTLFLRHFLEQLSGAGIEILGEGRVDAAVLILRGDRDGQNFSLRQSGKILHKGISAF